MSPPTSASDTLTSPAPLLYRLGILWIAAIYGGALALLPIDVFKDRDNYLAYAENSRDILLGFWDSGVLITLANEPLWLLINIALGQIFSPEITLRALVFIPATVVAYIVLSKDPRHFLWLLLILFVPQVIKNHIIHLRQGAAIAVFLLGWFSPSRFRRWLFSPRHQWFIPPSSSFLGSC